MGACKYRPLNLVKADMKNILLVGLGYHAKRIYYPSLCKLQDKKRVGDIFIVDLKSKKIDILQFLEENNGGDIKTLFVGKNSITGGNLNKNTENLLTELVHKNKIDGVIISTEPLAHMVYARWAMKNNLSVLMDKPISTHKWVSTSLKAAELLVSDYDELSLMYRKAKKKNRGIVFSLMAQRRYHTAFRKVRSLIQEVSNRTNCPVTSIQSFHTDGQWRFPSEIVRQDYHPYNQGYGKCSHSGYHSLDLVPWFLAAGETEGKEVNNVDIFSSFLLPNDFLAQFSLTDYKNIFPDFDQHNTYNKEQLLHLQKRFGEIDAFSTLTFKQNEKTLALGSVNLAHNGFSQRCWASAEGRDLYKGNGRIRHESHYISQGPFQAISLISYQSKELDPNDCNNLYDFGGEYHLDILVFRNSALFKDWHNFERFSTQDLNINILEGKSRGHQEDARFTAVQEFIECINNPDKVSVSDLLDHRRSVVLMSGIYQSVILKQNGANPLVNLNW